MLEEQRLDKKKHLCKQFDCGNPALNDYLVRQSGQDQRRNLTRLYVLTDSTQPGNILGFYTLSAAQVEAEQLPHNVQKKLPKYPIPCFRMGRLAVSVEQQGRGIGKHLIGCAVDRCLVAQKEIGAYALIVDAKDNQAKAFYEYFGFVPCADSSMTLFLGLGK